MTAPSSPSACPDDFALVNDLLDGRLDASQATAARARIQSEPALKDLWDDLLQIRTCMREHSARGQDLAAPPDFLARVRTGIAVSQAERVASDGQGPAAGGARPKGRMLRLLTVAYAAAALLVVAFGVQFALRDRGPAPDTVTTADRDKEAGSPGAADDGDAVKQAAVDARAGFPPETRARGASRAAGEKGAERDAKDRPVAREEAEGRREPAGAYAAPGGALRPGLRVPADAPPATPPATGPPASEPPAQDAPAVLFVFEAGDPSQARSEVEALLAQVRFVDPSALETGGARDTGGAPDTRPAPVRDAESKRRRTPAPPGAPAPAEGPSRLPPATRLYRVPAGAESLARLKAPPSGPAERDEAEPSGVEPGKAKGGRGAGGAGSGPARETVDEDPLPVLGSVERILDPASFARLEKLVGFAVWGRERGVLGKHEPLGLSGAPTTPGLAASPRGSPAPALDPAPPGVRIRILIVRRP